MIKFLKSILCFILVWTILFSIAYYAFPSMLFEHSEIEQPVNPTIHSKPKITETAEYFRDNEVYADVCSQILEFKNEARVKTKNRLHNNDALKILTQMQNDYPEIFWLGNSYYATTMTDGSIVNFGNAEWLDEKEIPNMYNDFIKKADAIIQGIPDGSDYEKVLYVHDYIINNTTYNHAVAQKTAPRNLTGTAYGCIVEGDAVCEGYARAFQYIMKQIGIESGICIGSNHAWNYVKIDGDYYWIDVTWDDTDKDYPRYTYFLIDDDMLLRTRTFEDVQSYVPECTKTEKNYFVMNDGYFTEYNEKAVLSYINSHDGGCEIMFSDYETYKKALNKLIADSHIRKSKNIGFSSFYYVRYDDMFSIYINY